MTDIAAGLAVDASFAAFGKAATYTPPGGGTATLCTVLLLKPENLGPHGDATPLAGHKIIEVRQSEVAQPLGAGSFGPPLVPVAGRNELAATYSIIDQPRPSDDDGLVWTMWVA